MILGRFIIDLEVVRLGHKVNKLLSKLMLLFFSKVESMNYTTYIANQNIGTTYKRTLISFDAGANWNKIKPPGNNSYCQLVNSYKHFFNRYMYNIVKQNAFIISLKTVHVISALVLVKENSFNDNTNFLHIKCN